jgi:hypothetical protein
MTREQLRKRGYRPIVKSSDLHAWGYQIVHWVNARDFARVVYEYVPRPADPRNEHNRGRTLPRLTASNYAKQVRAHRLIGAPVWGPRWRAEQLDLFAPDWQPMQQVAMWDENNRRKSVSKSPPK